MEHTRPIALKCKISAGAFSDERIFEVELPNADEPYVGAAARQYCWDEDGKPLGEGEPANGQRIAGRVAARLLEVRDPNAVVSIPDGEVIVVSRSLITKRPGSAHNVLVES